MKKWSWLGLLLAGTMVCLATAAQPRESFYGADWRLSGKKIRDESRVAVEGQAKAIRDDDLQAAYDYAASGIRRQFSPAVFAAMLRRGYPAIVHHVSLDVGLARDDGKDHAWVPVRFTDKLGRETAYRYYLILEDGAWLIEGVLPENESKDVSL